MERSNSSASVGGHSHAVDDQTVRRLTDSLALVRAYSLQLDPAGRDQSSGRLTRPARTESSKWHGPPPVAQSAFDRTSDGTAACQMPARNAGLPQAERRSALRAWVVERPWPTMLHPGPNPVRPYERSSGLHGHSSSASGPASGFSRSNFQRTGLVRM